MRQRSLQMDDETFDVMTQNAARRKLSRSAYIRTLVMSDAEHNRQPAPAKPTDPPRSGAATREDAGAPAGEPKQGIVLPDPGADEFVVSGNSVRTKRDKPKLGEPGYRRPRRDIDL